jgi:hypothetical protein
MKKKTMYHDDSYFHHAYSRNPDFRKKPINYSDEYEEKDIDHNETMKKAMRWIKESFPQHDVTLKTTHFNKGDNDGKL